MAAGLCLPRGLRPYLRTDTVQPGLGNRVQSIVEMNKEDIAGISVMRAPSLAPSAVGRDYVRVAASTQACRTGSLRRGSTTTQLEGSARSGFGRRGVSGLGCCAACAISRSGESGSRCPPSIRRVRLALSTVQPTLNLAAAWPPTSPSGRAVDSRRFAVCMPLRLRRAQDLVQNGRGVSPGGQGQVEHQLIGLRPSP